MQSDTERVLVIPRGFEPLVGATASGEFAGLTHENKLSVVARGSAAIFRPAPFLM